MYFYWLFRDFLIINLLRKENKDDFVEDHPIANEWEPYNATLLQSTDILMYDLITR